MSSIFQNFLLGHQAGRQNLEHRQEQSKLAQLQALAPQVIAGDPSAFTQAAALDPAKATQYQQAGDGLLRRLQNYIRHMDAARATGKPEAVQAALRAGAPLIKQLTGRDVPPDATWTPDWDAGWEELKAKVAMVPPQSSEAAPAGYRQFQLMAEAAGLNPGTPEYQQAAKIALGQEGRASSAGFGFDIIDIGDGRPRRSRENPRTGALEYYDERVGGWVQLGGPAAMGMPAPTAPAAVTGTPADAEEAAKLANAYYQQLRAAGLPDEQAAQATEVYLQGLQRQSASAPASAGVPPAATAPAPSAPSAGAPLLVPDMQRGGLVAPPGIGAGRTKEEEAAATEAAKIQTTLKYAPQVAAAEADAARAKKLAEAGAEREAQAPKRIASYRQALQAAGNVETSINRALEMIGPASTGFVGARLRGVEGSPAYNLAAEIETVKANLGFDRLQQMRDNSPTGGALGSIAVQELVALQSTIANLDPNQSEEQIRANLERVKTHYANWRSAVEQALAEEERRGSGQRASATNLTRVQSAADYQALAPGAEYIAPDGSLRRKR